jgi:hypothetical protein
MAHLLKFVFERLANFETNVTNFEKMENKFKISRRKNLLLVLILSVYIMFIGGLSFTIHKYVPHLTLIAFVSIFLWFPIIYIFRKNKNPLRLAYIMFYIHLPILITTTLISFYYAGFNLERFLLAILLCAFLCVCYSSVYLFTIDKLTQTHNYELTFFLTENEVIIGKLVTVTSRGDYIINTEQADEEVFIMRHQIKKISYKNIN